MRTQASPPAANTTACPDCGAFSEPKLASLHLFQQRLIDHLLVEGTVLSAGYQYQSSLVQFLPAVTPTPHTHAHTLTIPAPVLLSYCENSE